MWRPLCLLLLLAVHVPVLAGPWRAAERNVYGWKLMTPDERVEHQRRLRGFTAYEDCRAYQAAHHAEMAERARAAGVVLTPRRQAACEELRAQGRLQ